MMDRVRAVALGNSPADILLKNGRVVDVLTETIYEADVAIAEGVIAGVGSYDKAEQIIDLKGAYVAPGLINAHCHVESSMAVPEHYCAEELRWGVTTLITDPHEIANVAGAAGIHYMLEAGGQMPLNYYVNLPSCVPATRFEHSGCVMDARDMIKLVNEPGVLGMGEMMNVPGVIYNSAEVQKKLDLFLSLGRVIDGHAPCVRGKELAAYVASGIDTDHESISWEEAKEKLRNGLAVLVREGSASRNLTAILRGVIDEGIDVSSLAFCTDDKHPNDLLEKGHIDYICREAINKYGVDPIIAVKAAGHHAARYFLLNNRGAIAPGYLADFVIIDDFDHFNIEKVYKRGVLMVDHGVVADFPVPEIDPYLVNRAHDTFHVAPLTAADFTDSRPHAVIGMVNGEITTTDGGYTDRIDVDYDILKIAVIERHKNTHHIGLGYIKGYGLQKGAVATSISHDSHNIIVVGTNEEDMAFAANRIVQQHGGITVVENGQVKGELLLAIAGIMSDDTLINVNRDLENAKKAAYDLGVSTGIDPFMTLSFMALPVIPSLRITTRGVFDVTTQRYV